MSSREGFAPSAERSERLGLGFTRRLSNKLGQAIPGGVGEPGGQSVGSSYLSFMVVGS